MVKPRRAFFFLIAIAYALTGAVSMQAKATGRSKHRDEMAGGIRT
jgi:hypothetical protein